MADVVARELVDEIRGYHPRFASQETPQIVVLQALVRQLNKFNAAHAKDDPDYVSVPGGVLKERIDWFLNPATIDLAVAEAQGYANAAAMVLDYSRGIPVPPFVTLVGDLAILIDDGRAAPVTLVGLSEQVIPRYTTDVNLRALSYFPTLAYRDSRLVPTDRRRWEGGDTHGWETYVGPLSYSYVPHYKAVDIEGLHQTLSVPSSDRELILAETVYMLATRLELFEFAAATQRQFLENAVSVINQLGVASAQSASVS